MVATAVFLLSVANPLLYDCIEIPYHPHDASYIIIRQL